MAKPVVSPIASASFVPPPLASTDKFQSPELVGGVAFQDVQVRIENKEDVLDDASFITIL